MASKSRVGDYVSLQRGTTYQGSLVGKPGPALLGLGSIIPGGGFRTGDYKTYGGECPPKLMLFPGDLFVSLKGATKDGEMIGSVARVPSTVPSGRLTQDTVKLEFYEPAPETKDFLYWVLRTQHYRKYCAARATGSAVVALSREDFLGYPVPPRTTERMTIVELLGAIDDKIALNRRMNETLENMARALFKSWFVDFDPVRAKAEGRDPDVPKSLADLFPDSFEDSGLGRIPKKWTASSLSEVISIHDSKRIPLSNLERAVRRGSYPYYGAASILDYVDGYLFDGVYVLVGEDGTVVNDDDSPVVQYVWGKFWVNNHAHVLRGKNGFSEEQLFLLLKSVNIRPFVTGAVQPKVNQANLCRIPIVLPPETISTVFSRLVDNLFARIRLNTEQGITLSALRDALLPKLISGELRIHDAERIVGKKV